MFKLGENSTQITCRCSKGGLHCISHLQHLMGTVYTSRTFGHMYSTYACTQLYGTHSNEDPFLLWLIYVYNSVIQTLWFTYLLIRQVSKRITVGSSERSTIYGGSNSSACSPKALISWR